MGKKFFGIKSQNYIFEIYDLTTLLTILNVSLIIAGWEYAPLIGIMNCGIFVVNSIKNHTHINNYVTQIALLIMNLYFLY